MSLKRGVFFGLAIIIIGTPVVIGVAFFIAFKDKIFPNSFINNLDLGGLTKEQAVKVLEEKTTGIPEKITLAHGELTWEINTPSVNLYYDFPKTAENIYQTSRKTPVKNWFAVKNFGLEFFFEEPAIESTLATIAAQIEQPAIPAQIIFDLKTKQISAEKGKLGYKLAIDKSKKTITEKIRFNQFDKPINLQTEKLNHLPTDEEINLAKERAIKLIDKTITLTSSQQNFVLKDEQLINFVGFSNSWDREKIAEYAQVLSQSLTKEPKDALFQFKDGKAISFQPDQPGYQLSVEETIDKITVALNKAIESSGANVVELPLSVISPKIKNSDTNVLGVKDLLGKGESNFKGSIASRIHNLDLASGKINGLLIAPGEVFSLNNALGEISAATGYQDAYIIQGGRTILGAGGGVCQVSTTIFRAAINAGLPIVERYPHAYRVHYYENDSKTGFDAAVFSPNQDFKFKNNTDAYILIQREFNPKTYYLAFNLYGSSDGRKVEITNVRLWDIIPPPEDQYIDDPTLPLGQTKQIDFKAWGAKAAFDWKVTKEGNMLYQQTFFSHYRPWQAIYLKGTKQ